jgi:hypothetical protein
MGFVAVSSLIAIAVAGAHAAIPAYVEIFSASLEHGSNDVFSLSSAGNFGLASDSKSMHLANIYHILVIDFNIL